MSHTKVLPNDPANDIDEGEFGLTDSEYQFLMEDIDRVIAEANRKWDYSGKYVEPEQKKEDKPTVESIMVARGLIKTRRVHNNNNNNNNNRIPTFVELPIQKEKEVKS